jgi:hypothetical protein
MKFATQMSVKIEQDKHSTFQQKEQARIPGADKVTVTCNVMPPATGRVELPCRALSHLVLVSVLTAQLSASLYCHSTSRIFNDLLK